MSDYYYICGDPTVPDSCRVHRTIDVSDNIQVDIDENNKVIGVETLAGLVDFEELVEVLKVVKIVQDNRSQPKDV